ncbi:MAG TPA: hypothetical protein VFC77_10870 [Myxococcota bacterium]|nr:hypothetical protein [Myxococcota bacterium]
MLRHLRICIPLLLLAAVATGEEPAQKGDKQLLGISILGNDDAPKSLVIVPWKSSEPGDALAVSRGLDAGRQPVDRDVFLRELDYYEIRATPPEAAGAAGQ